LLEKTLAADNVFVWLMLFSYFAVPLTGDPSNRFYKQSIICRCSARLRSLSRQKRANPFVLVITQH
ncbi:hypothetical protein CE195_04940, partial [Sodalis-like symbiont of Philaenus spumarius]